MNTKKVFLSLLSAISLCLNCQTSFSTKGKKAKECEDANVDKNFLGKLRNGELRCVRTNITAKGADELSSSYIEAFKGGSDSEFVDDPRFKDCGSVMNFCKFQNENMQIFKYVIQDPSENEEKTVCYAVLYKINVNSFMLSRFWTLKRYQKKGYGYKFLSAIVNKFSKDRYNIIVKSTEEGEKLYSKVLFRSDPKKLLFKTIMKDGKVYSKLSKSKDI